MLAMWPPNSRKKTLAYSNNPSMTNIHEVAGSKQISIQTVNRDIDKTLLQSPPFINCISLIKPSNKRKSLGESESRRKKHSSFMPLAHLDPVKDEVYSPSLYNPKNIALKSDFVSKYTVSPRD